MKKFLVLVFILGTLKEAMSIDINSHPDLKPFLEDGFTIDHACGPVITQLVSDGNPDVYSAAVTVELEKGNVRVELMKEKMQQMVDIYQASVAAQPAPMQPIEEGQPMPIEELEAELKNLVVPKLKEMAESYGIQNLQKLKKTELIAAILEKYKQEAFGTPSELPNISLRPIEHPVEPPTDQSDNTPPPVETPTAQPKPKAQKKTRAQIKRERRAEKRKDKK